MTASDSLFGVVPAFSGATLIRVPTGGLSSTEFLRQTEQGLSGYLAALSARATALYTVPASLRLARFRRVAGFAFKGQARPGKSSS